MKTPTHILLFADTKREAQRLLERQHKNLSSFVQEKIDELVRASKQKEIVYIKCPPYQNVLPLDEKQDPYNYDYPLKTISNTDVEAEISLSFSQRLRLGVDSI